MSSSDSSDDEYPTHAVRKIEASIRQKRRVQRKIKHARTHARHLRSDIEALKAKTEKSIQEAGLRLQAIGQAAKSKEDNHKDFSVKLGAASGELTFVKGTAEKQVLDFSSAQALLTQTESELAKVTLELKKVKQEEHDLEAHDKLLEELTAREAAQIAELQAKQAKEQEETAALNAKANEEKEKLHVLYDQLRKLDDELGSLNKLIKDHEIEIEHLGGHVEEIVRKKLPPTHAEIQTHANLYDSKTGQLTKIQTDLGLILEKIPPEVGEKKDLLAFLDTHTMTLAQLRKRVIDVENEIHEVETTKQSIQNSYLQAVEAHKAEAEALEKTTAELGEVNIKLKNIRKENDEVFAQVSELKEKVKALAAAEAAVEGAEAELKEKEALERAELEALQVKEAEERDAIEAIKKEILAAKHLLQEDERVTGQHKEVHQKLVTDLTGLSTLIESVEKETNSVIEETKSYHAKITEANNTIASASKRLAQLEAQQASLAHLEGELDEKIKEVAHREATEHKEFEESESKVLKLTAQLASVQQEIAKAQSTLDAKNKEHETKLSSAQLDIKAHETESSHRFDILGFVEKELAALAAIVESYSPAAKVEKKKKKQAKAKKVHHHQRHRSPSVSTSSSWSD